MTRVQFKQHHHHHPD
ncbi:his operon leader peptide [Escherichia coli O157:H7]|nr:his operon leader peptide [Salmonella enterica]MBL5675674.1 his operon leader peptide [Escherichia coli O157:H7]MBL5706885.1 his operon leader peptide [Escherichia coli O157:H7]